MRIAIICNDTRGGIQPYAALAVGLKAAGYDVRAVAPANFSEMFVNAGIAFVPLTTGSQAEMQAGTAIAEKGTLASMRFMARELPARIETVTRETLMACEDVDVISGGVGGMITGLSVAEKLGKPFIESHLQPIGVATDRYPGVFLPRWTWKPFIRLSHHLSEMAVWMPFRAAMAKARRNVLGLPNARMRANASPVIYAYSPKVVPMPTEGTRARHVVGYWTLPTPPDYRPPQRLEEFLRQPGPIVSIGFGSMASSDPEAMTALVREAVDMADVRAVLLSGWGGLSPIETDRIFPAEALPHDWLFPRMAAVVHHGGAGTTGAAFVAGVPAVVVPFGVDQPFWGARVAALGTGPDPVPRKLLTAERLAAALRLAVSDAKMRRRAADLGVSIRQENGVAEAVKVFDHLARR